MTLLLSWAAFGFTGLVAVAACHGNQCTAKSGSLLQHTLRQQRPKKVRQSYGPFPNARGPLAYFQRWAEMDVKAELEMEDQAIWMEDPQADLSLAQVSSMTGLTTAAQQVTAVLDNAYVRECDFEGLHPSRDWALQSLSKAADEKAPHHALLRSPQGELQYMAFRGHRVLMADPPLCMQKPQKLAVSLLLDSEPEEEVDPETEDENEEEAAADVSDLLDATEGDNTTMLHPTGDWTVIDCMAMFSRLGKELCSKTYRPEVIAADMRIIDGFEVTAYVKMVNDNGDAVYHDVLCDFEVPATPDASLLQTETLPMHQDGEFQLSIHMSGDLCEADKYSTFSSGRGFIEHELSLGEISFYKGFENINRGIPNVTKQVLMQTEEVPAEMDLREAYPKCFPLNGSETVRSQGRCGSCWAFASATMAMSNLCIVSDGRGSLAKEDDRFEVSTQQIIECSAAAVEDLGTGCAGGCNGGSFHLSFIAWQKVGIARERDAPYLCGDNSCARLPPYSSQNCDLRYQNPQWHFAGAAGVHGEHAMMKMLATGQTMYASMKIAQSFSLVSEMAKRGEVYMGCERQKIYGGHAVVIVGYGKKEGVSYWTIQNSWGTRWGADGYFKMKRNECGLQAGYVSKMWVTGGQKPKCQDSDITEFFVCFRNPATKKTTHCRNMDCSEAAKFALLADPETGGCQTEADLYSQMEQNGTVPYLKGKHNHVSFLAAQYCPVTCGYCPAFDLDIPPPTTAAPLHPVRRRRVPIKIEPKPPPTTTTTTSTTETQFFCMDAKPEHKESCDFYYWKGYCNRVHLAIDAREGSPIWAFKHFGNPDCDLWQPGSGLHCDARKSCRLTCGFDNCTAQPPPPTTSTTTTPFALPGGVAWGVEEGPCRLENDCILSPAFPKMWYTGKYCRIKVAPELWNGYMLTVKSFKVGLGEYLEVNGQKFTGFKSEAPDLEGLVPSTDIEWLKGWKYVSGQGYVIDRGGWKICRIHEQNAPTEKVVAQCVRKGMRWTPVMPGQPGVNVGSGKISDCQVRCASVSGCAHFAFWDRGECQLQDASATLQMGGGMSAGPPDCNSVDIRLPIVAIDSTKAQLGDLAVFDWPAELDHLTKSWGTPVASEIILDARICNAKGGGEIQNYKLSRRGEGRGAALRTNGRTLGVWEVGHYITNGVCDTTTTTTKEECTRWVKGRWNNRKKKWIPGRYVRC
eukprot:TRINITY_DN90521_c0_g1_i1.p1 TRINITY_DN90521_c0_g1~~TRINITY_DN90521_c0_g1_i1.p1  ORF type:complete len:1193 (+),score=215.95 TRINITY_DN90521_c0_g1_i1:82-3660(+)